MPAAYFYPLLGVARVKSTSMEPLFGLKTVVCRTTTLLLSMMGPNGGHHDGRDTAGRGMAGRGGQCGGGTAGEGGVRNAG